MVLFTFDSKTEVDTILANEPWSFDKHLMVLRRYDGVSDVQLMDFNLTPFWIQVHGIPIKFMNPTVAEGLCETAGVVQNHSNLKTEGCGGFMRVRVLVDISQPLCRGRVITLDDDKEMWVSFKYERLPNICYWCGCLTHNDRDCERWIESDGTLEESNREFGPWIRASPMTGSRKSVVSVPGFYAKKKATLHAQRKTDEPWRAAATESSNMVKPNMASNNHGISPTITNTEDTFLSGTHNVVRPHLSPCLVHSLRPEDSFEKHIEDIDRDLRKFDLPTPNGANTHLPDTLKPPIPDTRSPNTPHNPHHAPKRPTNLTPEDHKPHQTFDQPNPNTLTTPHGHNPQQTTNQPIPNTLTTKDDHDLNPSAPDSPNLTPTSSNTTNRPTWKRMPRAEVEQKPCQLASCGTKRTLPDYKHQSELPKRRAVVSQVDEVELQILAKAGPQPCQEQ